jgi:hypothetical protein
MPNEYKNSNGTYQVLNYNIHPLVTYYSTTFCITISHQKFNIPLIKLIKFYCVIGLKGTQSHLTLIKSY